MLSEEMPAFGAVVEWRNGCFVVGPISSDSTVLVDGVSVGFGKGVILRPGAKVRVGGVAMTFNEARKDHFKEPCR